MQRTLAKVTMPGICEYRVVMSDNREKPYRVLKVWHGLNKNDVWTKRQQTVAEYTDYTSCLVRIATISSKHLL